MFVFCAEGGPLAEGSVVRATTDEQKTEQTSPTPSVSTATGLVYDERMMEHLNMWDRWVTCEYENKLARNLNVILWLKLCVCRHHPEQPQRIFKIFSKHQQLGLVDRCQRIPARLATEEELSRCHRYVHFNFLFCWDAVITFKCTHINGG